MRAIGIILAGGNNRKMRELSQKRAIGAMPVAGSYRSIDFALSNMTNSHIQRVGVLTQYNARSLNAHLSSSKWWDFGRKQGGLFLFTPAVTAENSSWYRGTADAIYQNLSFLKNSHEPYVVITSGDCVYKMDYNKVLEYHISKKADVIDMIERCAMEDRYDFVKDILIRYKNQKRIFGYKIKDYWKNIATVEDYFDANMDFLKPEIRNYFFKQYPDIYSKVDDLPPAKYNVGAKVENSLISSGCIVNGTVEDSVIFKKSFIGNNCYIKNSIILNDVYIGDNTHIENCIVESRDTIRANSFYRGEDEIKIVIEKNDRYII